MEDGILFRRGFTQAPLRSIASDEVVIVLKEVNSGDCDEHQEGPSLFK